MLPRLAPRAQGERTPPWLVLCPMRRPSFCARCEGPRSVPDAQASGLRFRKFKAAPFDSIFKFVRGKGTKRAIHENREKFIFEELGVGMEVAAFMKKRDILEKLLWGQRHPTVAQIYVGCISRRIVRTTEAIFTVAEFFNRILPICLWRQMTVIDLRIANSGKVE